MPGGANTAKIHVLPDFVVLADLEGCLGNKDGSMLNGSVAVIAKMIKNVVASAAEAEVGALFVSAQLAAPMRAALEELGHPVLPSARSFRFFPRSPPRQSCRRCEKCAWLLLKFLKKLGRNMRKIKKMRKRENPPKEEKTEGKGGNKKHGRLGILFNCAHCVRKSISPDRTSGNPFSYRKQSK